MTAAEGIDMQRRESGGPCLILDYDRCELDRRWLRAALAAA
jgi:hypothetical protein